MSIAKVNIYTTHSPPILSNAKISDDNNARESANKTAFMSITEIKISDTLFGLCEFVAIALVAERPKP